MFGRTTFKEFLEAGEGIASNILADRLKALEAAGIVTKQRDADDARKSRYALTSRGLDLAPIVIDMIVWGARHYETNAQPVMIRQIARNRDQVIADIRGRWAKATDASRDSHLVRVA